MSNLKRLDECKAGDKVHRYLLRKHGTYTVVRRNGMTVEVITELGRRGELYAWHLVEVI